MWKGRARRSGRGPSRRRCQGGRARVTVSHRVTTGRPRGGRGTCGWAARGIAGAAPTITPRQLRRGHGACTCVRAHGAVPGILSGAPAWRLVAGLARRGVSWPAGQQAEHDHRHQAERRPRAGRGASRRGQSASRPAGSPTLAPRQRVGRPRSRPHLEAVAARSATVSSDHGCGHPPRKPRPSHR